MFTLPVHIFSLLLADLLADHQNKFLRPAPSIPHDGGEQNLGLLFRHFSTVYFAQDAHQPNTNSLGGKAKASCKSKLESTTNGLPPATGKNSKVIERRLSKTWSPNGCGCQCLFDVQRSLKDHAPLHKFGLCCPTSIWCPLMQTSTSIGQPTPDHIPKQPVDMDVIHGLFRQRRMSEPLCGAM